MILEEKQKLVVDVPLGEGLVDLCVVGLVKVSEEFNDLCPTPAERLVRETILEAMCILQLGIFIRGPQVPSNRMRDDISEKFQHLKQIFKLWAEVARPRGGRFNLILFI